jgi:L-arabinose isomerase
MQPEKPKLGVAFFVAKWFDEVVLGKEESSQAFNRFLKEETGRVLERLKRDHALVVPPLISSMEKARSAVKQFFAEDVNALLLVFLVWSEDEYLLPFRDIMAVRPSILWASTPYKRPPEKSSIMELFVNSGIVGSFEAFGVIKGMLASPGMRTRPFFVFGSSRDEGPYGEIGRIARAALVRKALGEMRFGMLPCRNPQMIVTYVDEFELYSTVGPAVEYVSALQLKKAADSIPGSAVAEYARKVKSECTIDARITDDNLLASTRASLGMEKLMFDRGLDGLALSDLNPELHEVMGLRPCLYPERLARSGKVVGIEGDLGGTTAMAVLGGLTGKPVMFTEIFNYDAETGTVVAGHAGPSNYLLAGGGSRITITPDYELMDSPSGIGGVWMEFVAGPGRVTMVNLFRGAPGQRSGTFQMTVLGGESLGGDLRVEGYAHAAVRIDPDITRFLGSCAENGTSHHWAIVHGDVQKELGYICDMLSIKKVTFD